MNTIWGRADSITTIAEGIVRVSTPSHGGYILSQARLNEMLPQLRQCSYTNDNNFEEDCAWCAVVLMWPAYFDVTQIDSARMFYKRCYRDKFGELPITMQTLAA
jgi:hypothetical protein